MSECVLFSRALGGFVAYLVIGGIFMYTQRGARGAEIIPTIPSGKTYPS